MAKDRFLFLISIAGLGILMAFLLRNGDSIPSPTSIPQTRPAGEVQQKQMEVLVAQKELVAGKKLQDGEYAWEKIDPNQFEPTLVKRDEHLDQWMDQAMVSRKVNKGDRIKQNDIIWPDEEENLGEYEFPPEEGKRGVPFSLKDYPAVAQFMEPGKYVDVIFTSKSDLGFGTMSLTLLKNIRILSVRTSKDKGSSSPSFAKGGEVLLEMGGREAEIFSYAQEAGSISIGLTDEVQPDHENRQLTELLMNSQSAGNFNSILVTHLIRTLFPKANVEVTATTKGFIVAGTVRDPQVADKILEILDKMAIDGEKAVVNLMKVVPQQVVVCVRVLEVVRDTFKRLGLNWEVLYQDGGASVALAALFPRPLLSDPNFVFDMDKVKAGNFTLSAIIDMLEERGYGRVLAEPNLATISGEPAHFFAGGEFPILVPQGGDLVGTVTVVYKKFGVILDFTPFVDLNGLITLHIVPEVSSIDKQNAVEFQGFVIPSLISRRADTTVKLWPGQSYAIAGLMKYERIGRVFSLYGLDRLPIVGPLFRSKRFTDRKTELMILITPYLVSSDQEERTGECIEIPRGPCESTFCETPLCPCH